MNSYDTIPQRRGSGSIKWDHLPHPGAPEQTPLWVADMDFPAPKAVIEAIKKRAEHGVFGYTVPTPSYFQAVDYWFSKRFGLSVPQEQIIISPGIVPAIHVAIRAFSNPGDGVIVQQPVYYPFSSAVQQNGRKLIVNQLLEKDGYYSIDFPSLEKQAAEAKLLILCSPHNPVGRIWKREELKEIARIAKEHDMMVISDEIHCDLVMPDAPHQHTPWYCLGEEIADRSILCTAPSKSFNIPGLATSNIIIANKTIRDSFRKELFKSASDLPNCFGEVACQAAYWNGESWLEETMAYIAGNRDALTSYLSQALPEARLCPMEATYLAWLDLRTILSRAGKTSAELEKLLCDEAGVWLEAGSLFGDGGEGFMRINIASSRTLLLEAFERVVKRIKNL